MKKEQRGSWLFTVPNTPEGIAWLRQAAKYKSKTFRLLARGRGHRGSGDEAIPCTTWNRDLPIEHAERIVVYVHFRQGENFGSYQFNQGVRHAQHELMQSRDLVPRERLCMVEMELHNEQKRVADLIEQLTRQAEYIRHQDEQIKAQGKTIESLMLYDCRVLNYQLDRLWAAEHELMGRINVLKKRLAERASVEITLERSEHGEEASQAGTPE